jgi:hypothetical protein
MTNNHFKEKYFAALGIPKKGERRREMLKDALIRAHEIRNFEIELYWKRATYFWALEAATFAAFALLWRDMPMDTRPLAVAFAGIGLLTAWAGWLSAGGSKFWQENWEKHIELLEDEFEGRLHKTIWIGQEGIQTSVSQVNRRLHFVLLIFWLGLLAVTTCLVLSLPIWKLPLSVILALGLIAILAAGGWLWRARSQLIGEIYEESAKDWQPFSSAVKAKKFRILRRYAPGEPQTGRTME